MKKNFSVAKKMVLILILLMSNLASIAFGDTSRGLEETSELGVDLNIISPRYVAYCPESPDGIHDMWLASSMGQAFVVYKPTDQSMFGSEEGGKCFSCRYCEQKLITQHSPLDRTIGRYAIGYYTGDPNIVYGHGQYIPDMAGHVIYTNYSLAQLPYSGTSTIQGYRFTVVWPWFNL